MDVLLSFTRLKNLFSCLYQHLALRVHLSATKLKHHFFMVYRVLALHVHPFWFHLLYVLLLSSLGSLVLLLFGRRRLEHAATPVGFLDLFYMSVSASTVTGLNSIELEHLSHPQVVVLTLLMLAGGEVFLSFLSLLLRFHKLKLLEGPVANIGSSNRVEPQSANELDLGGHSVPLTPEQARYMKYRCLAYLTCVVFLYHVFFHALGVGAIALYLRHVPSARSVLRAKGLRPIPFAISLAVSAFANGGIVPTNENMLVFAKNSGLLLAIVILILVGNTLFSTMLRAIVTVLGSLSHREEVDYMLESPESLSFEHLHPKRSAVMVEATVAGVWVVQLVVLLVMGRNKGYFQGLSPFQRVASGVFQATNARHCGMSSVDLAEVSPAALVVVTWAMYLPSYTSFLPFKIEEEHTREEELEKGIRYWLKIANLPQISYVAIFIIIVCIIEREKMSNDPINFSFLFVAFEVVSAYGNAGFSTGYACQRQLIPNSTCKNMSIALSGKWSNLGKLMIIFVMIFGRLKRFHLGGGKAWRNKHPN